MQRVHTPFDLWPTNPHTPPRTPPAAATDTLAVFQPPPSQVVVASGEARFVFTATIARMGVVFFFHNDQQQLWLMVRVQKQAARGSLWRFGWIVVHCLVDGGARFNSERCKQVSRAFKGITLSAMQATKYGVSKRRLLPWRGGVEKNVQDSGDNGFQKKNEEIRDLKL